MVRPSPGAARPQRRTQRKSDRTRRLNVRSRGLPCQRPSTSITLGATVPCEWRWSRSASVQAAATGPFCTPRSVISHSTCACACLWATVFSRTVRCAMLLYGSSSCGFVTARAQSSDYRFRARSQQRGNCCRHNHGDTQLARDRCGDPRDRWWRRCRPCSQMALGAGTCRRTPCALGALPAVLAGKDNQARPAECLARPVEDARSGGCWLRHLPLYRRRSSRFSQRRDALPTPPAR